MFTRLTPHLLLLYAVLARERERGIPAQAERREAARIADSSRPAVAAAKPPRLDEDTKSCGADQYEIPPKIKM